MATSLRSISCLRSGLVALLLAGGACADDAPSLTTLGGSETGDDTTTNATTTGVTTIDPDSSGGSMGMDSGDTTRGESTEGTTTAPDTDSATTNPTDGDPVCGNGMIEAGEDCESEDLGGADCASQGFSGGVLLCNKDCLFDTSQCTASDCGNGMIDGMEDCDGAELDGASCQTEGFDGGNLACADDCTFDTSDCSVDACGNGAVDAGETCDGVDLNGEDCVTQGFMGGALACAGDCLGYDTSGCMDGGTCTHDICVTGEALVDGCDPCVTQICAVDAFCCADGWDGTCVGEVASICGIMCPPPPPVCGNDVTEAGETCDGADLVGETCLAQGFAGGGTLACAVDCLSYDTAGCIAMPGGDCCAAHAAIGCDNAACEASVCAADPFCCANSWDATCAADAIANPDCAGVGGSCPAGGGGDCCAAHAGTGCDDAACEASVCAADAFCCATAWDATCAADAIANPACAGVGGSCPGGGLACSDEDIGNVTGPAVAVGNTAGDDEDLQPSCGGAGGLDHVMTWTSTVAGNYTFDTFGSAYDTKLALYSDCATQLACNDDSGGAQSLLVQNLAAGQTILIAVDGFGGATGAWTLNITPPGGGGFACQDQDLGMAIGAAVAAGTTVGEDNDLNPSCGAGDALDRVFRFQAPAAGQYTFNTFGSGYDTVLSLFSDCATSLACNDDSGGLQSQLVRNMAAGEVVLILVDGYNGATGNYTLNITSP